MSWNELTEEWRAQPLDPDRIPKAGETWWFDHGRVQILRVSVKHRWADTWVTQPDGLMWSKRQPLPLASGFTRTRAAEEDTNG